LVCSLQVEDKISTGRFFSQGKRGGKTGKGKGIAAGIFSPFTAVSA
jgi:hypothetical protein